jgi:uncharacterized lipoprotein YmbA
MSRWINRLILPGFLGLLAACGSLSAKPDPSRFFTLSGISGIEEIRQTSESEKMILGVGPVRFPGYLDRQEIVVRSAQNRFNVSEYDRWAEPLDENFTRVLAQNLAGLLGTDRIVSYPWTSDKKPVRFVTLEVLSFESNSAREAELFARWSVVDGSSKKPLSLKVSRLARQAKDGSTDASVAALSEALGDLSREIAGALGALDGKGK